MGPADPFLKIVSGAGLIPASKHIRLREMTPRNKRPRIIIWVLLPAPCHPLPAPQTLRTSGNQPNDLSGAIRSDACKHQVPYKYSRKAPCLTARSPLVIRPTPSLASSQEARVGKSPRGKGGAGDRTVNFSSLSVPVRATGFSDLL